MALNTREQVGWWTFGAAIFLAVLWVVGDTLLPFIVGAALAYLLDPVADRLEARGLSRVAATVIITLGVILSVLVVLFLLIPLMVDQIRSLIETTPQYFDSLRTWLGANLPDLFEEGTPLRDALAKATDTFQSRALGVFENVVAGGMALVDFFLVLFLAPVVAFYLLLDWDRMMAKIDSWLPRDHAPTIRRLSKQIDQTLAGFVRGQGSVCLILGIFYAVALTVIGLQFGLVIGIIAGLISFIPFVGALVGGALSLGVALFQFWGEWQWIIAVAGIFIVGQLVEGNVLTPKLVGSSVGLHPVWLIFALSAFGSILGFTGMLIAVPVAAVIGVMTRFGLEEYMNGRLYKGRPEE